MTKVLIIIFTKYLFQYFPTSVAVMNSSPFILLLYQTTALKQAPSSNILIRNFPYDELSFLKIIYQDIPSFYFRINIPNMTSKKHQHHTLYSPSINLLHLACEIVKSVFITLIPAGFYCFIKRNSCEMIHCL